jgi:hypothetical protein
MGILSVGGKEIDCEDCDATGACPDCNGDGEIDE